MDQDEQEDQVEENKPKTVAQCQTQAELEEFSCPELRDFLEERGYSTTAVKSAHLRKPDLVGRIMLVLFPFSVSDPACCKGTLLENVLPDLFPLIYHYWLAHQRDQGRGALKAQYAEKAILQGSKKRAMKEPHGISIDAAGIIYVSDTKCHRVQVFNADYSHRADIGKRGCKEGKGNGEFSYPVASTVCFDGNLAVVDRKNHRVQIFKKTGKGDSWELRFKAKFGGQGAKDGFLHEPCAITSDNQGNLIVCDHKRVQVFTPSGGFLRKIILDVGRYSRIFDLVVDFNGDMAVALNGSHIMVFNAQGQFLRGIGSWGSEDPQYLSFAGLLLDKQGNLILYTEGHRQFKVYSKETGRHIKDFATSYFQHPKQMALDSDGNILVADSNRVVVLG